MGKDNDFMERRRRAEAKRLGIKMLEPRIKPLPPRLKELVPPDPDAGPSAAQPRARRRPRR